MELEHLHLFRDIMVVMELMVLEILTQEEVEEVQGLLVLMEVAVVAEAVGQD